MAITYNDYNTYKNLSAQEKVQDGDMFDASIGLFYAEKYGVDSKEAAAEYVNSIDPTTEAGAKTLERLGRLSEIKGPPSLGAVKERERIDQQRESMAQIRDDHFALGTVYLNIPPSQISISNETRNFRFQSLRSDGEVILSSGRGTQRIDLDVYFNGIDDINNKLRPLLAQYKTTPFLPIENEYIKSVVSPSLSNTEAARKEVVKAIEQKVKLDHKKDVKYTEISQVINTLKKDGHIDESVSSDYLRNDPTVILTQTDYRENLNSKIDPDMTPRDDISKVARLVKSVGDIQEEIIQIDKDSTDLSSQSIESRFADDQIIGVLSQFAISTVPGYPETLMARISIYVFNYSPFANKFSFIVGDDVKKWSNDITKCTLFIDWYASRFLSGMKSIDKIGLSEYHTGQGMTFGLYDAEKTDKKVEEFSLDEGTVISGITVSFRNIIQFIPILSYHNPTCQYMGSYNTDIQINLETKSKDQIKQLSRFIDRSNTLSRRANSTSRNSFIAIGNPLLKMCGMNYFAINTFETATVPGNPGLSTMSLGLSEYKIGTEARQVMNRINVTDQQEIDTVAEKIVEWAYAYKNGDERYKKFYALLFNNSDGWMENNSTNIVNEFMDKDKSWYDWIVNDGKSEDVSYNNTIRMQLERDIANHTRGASYTHPPVYAINTPIAATLYSQASLDESYRLYFEDVIKHSLNTGKNFDKHQFTTSRMLASVRRSDIKNLIIQGNDPMIDEITGNLQDGGGAGKETPCYPDLELPKYGDLNIGSEIMNTYRDTALISKTGELDVSVQSNTDEVDPDFFISRERVLKSLSESSDLNQGMERALGSFKAIASAADEFKATESLNEEDQARAISRVSSEGGNGTAIDVEATKAISPEERLGRNIVHVREIVGDDRERIALDTGDKDDFISEEALISNTYSNDTDNSEYNEIVGVTRWKGRERTLEETRQALNDPGGSFSLGLISGDIIQNAKDKDTGYSLFDRSSDMRIEAIVAMVQYNMKDNMLRFANAYPAYKLYFIDEDSEKWMGAIDDRYEYNVVQSIEIVRSRKDPVDTAVIRLVNTSGELDKSDFFNDDGTAKARPSEDSVNRADHETIDEQGASGLALKPGTRIQIKLGYSSDPNLLDNTFTGVVSEVIPGDIMTVMAHGYGVELLTQIAKDTYVEESAAVYKLLDKLVSNPRVLHFGKWELFPQNDSSKRIAGVNSELVEGRDGIVKYNWEGSGRWSYWYRKTRFLKHFYAFIDDQRNNNIYTPTTSWLYNKFHGGSQTILTKDKTIWEMFQDMSRRMPGFVATVLPFDYRATVYYGPIDGDYTFTAKDRQLKNALYEHELSKTNDEILNDYQKVHGRLEEIDDKTMLNTTSKTMSKLWSAAKASGDKKTLDGLREVIYSFSGYTSDANRKNSTRYLERKAYSLLDKDDPDNAIDERNVVLFSSILGQKNKSDIGFIQAGTGDATVQSYFEGKNRYNYYSTKDGKIVNDAIMRYERLSIANKSQKIDARRKPVRNFHYKDSMHHIVANNVIASTENMWNKVNVNFAEHKEWKGYAEGKSTYEEVLSKSSRISCQADDDIWPERIKEIDVVEENASDRIQAWLYGLGNLCLGMKEMYTGSLVVLGDATVKPYDYVFIKDYYTDMSGPVEVEQVVHHFSPETGFITTIVPDLVCHFNSIAQIGHMVASSAYVDSLSEHLYRAKIWSNNLTLGLASALGLDGVIFSMSKLRTDYREPIAITPLMYKGQPYVAGIEGFIKDTLIKSIKGECKDFLDDTGKTSKEIENFFKGVSKNLDQQRRSRI